MPSLESYFPFLGVAVKATPTPIASAEAITRAISERFCSLGMRMFINVVPSCFR
jgi:hypothetical protein